jgi:ERCC4-type nuclease
MLSSIPNISPKIATLIMKKYETIENMLKILRENGLDDLKTIMEVNDKGKKKKINKTVINNIEKFLLS